MQKYVKNGIHIPRTGHSISIFLQKIRLKTPFLAIQTIKTLARVYDLGHMSAPSPWHVRYVKHIFEMDGFGYKLYEIWMF